MAVEYNQHTWGYGEELTPDRLNNISGSGFSKQVRIYTPF